MNNQTYNEVIEDKIYEKGFKAGENKMKKKYNKLFALSSEFFEMYESSFGAPDDDNPDNKYYFDLRKLLKLPT